MSVLVVGSIAIDTVKTPVEEHSDLFGGSASYAALGASFFSPVRLSESWATIFPNPNFSFGNRARSTAKVCSARMAKLPLVGRILLGLEYARNALDRTERFRRFQAGVAGVVSRNRFRFARQHRAVVASPCARPDEAPPFCRR